MKLKFYLSIFLTFLISYSFAQTLPGIEFNGTDQYMKIPNHDDFKISATESFSVTCWINVPTYKSGMRFICKRGISVVSTTGYEMWNGGSSSQFYAINTPYGATSGNVLSAYSTSAGSLNTWIHVGFVVDRTTGKIYMYQNGNLVGTSTNPLKQTSTSSDPWTVENNLDVFVGAGIADAAMNPSNFFKGEIADLRFWDKALSKTDMQSDMTGTINKTTPNLLAAYDFKNIEGVTVSDIKGAHNATLVNFPVTTPVIVDVEQTRVSSFTGKSNTNEVICKLKVNVGGSGNLALTKIKLSKTASTNIVDVKKVKVFSTTNTDAFDSRSENGAILLGEANLAEGEFEIPLSGNLVPGYNYLWVTADVADDAREGNRIGVNFNALTYETSKIYNYTKTQPTAEREILLARKLVFAPGDYGSTNYRIPAIITADNGSLVILTDKRKYNNIDLPQDIDIVSRTSENNGKTWSEPVTVALGTGYGKGFGDAVVMKTKSGKLVTLFVGGAGLNSSTSTNPIRSYMSSSVDNGKSWTTPVEITSQIFGSSCADPTRASWQASFFGSGHGLCLRDGRLMVVAAIREVTGGSLNNYAIYSDNEGETWNISQRAISGGDEAKVVELNNGDILMSSRTTGNRLWAKSSDRGETWTSSGSWPEINGNACDADILRYTSTKDGYDKSRLLHTLPNASDRSNVTMWMSYDEGNTWPVKKTLCVDKSAYSSITILSDGTIGVYQEEDETVPYKMYYLNFSLDWLTSGSDKYTAPNTVESVKEPVFSVTEGIYNESQKVEITCSTPGTSIYYTTNGDNPTSSSTLYTTPVVIDNTTTLKAIAMKEGMSSSAVVKAVYTLMTNWSIPTGTYHTTETRYIAEANTTKAKADLNYTQDINPKKVYINTNQEFSVEAGSDFMLNVKTADAMKWCHAIVFIDWNKNYSFDDDDELIAKIGKDSWEDVNLYKYGNTDVNNFSLPIHIPATAKVGITRMRIQFMDAWHNKAVNHTHSGEDIIDKGGVYDFNINILQTATDNNELIEQEFSFYPNPAKDIIHFENVEQVWIYTVDGQLVYSNKNGINQLNVNFLNKGIYMVRMLDNNVIRTRKLIKE